MALGLRTLLIWLLVLAVPLQTAAAATMALCGQGHHATAAERGAAAPTAHQHSGAKAHSGHDSGHEHHASVAQASDAAEPTQVAPADAHKCSVCASCCSGTAMLGSMPKLVPPEFGVVAFVSLLPHIAFVAASGPDRPPRSKPA